MIPTFDGFVKRKQAPLRTERGLEQSEFLLHESVPVAVPIEVTHAVKFQAALGIALRIEFDELHPVAGDPGHKGDVVLLCHFVVDGEEVLVFHGLHGDGVGFVGGFGLQRRQSHPAAADDGLSHSVDHVAADGAAVKFGAEQIS